MTCKRCGRIQPAPASPCPECRQGSLPQKHTDTLQAVLDVRLFLYWAQNIAAQGVIPVLELLTDCVVVLREALSTP